MWLISFAREEAVSSEKAINLNIPQEYLVGFYGIILSFLVPTIARWYNRKRQGKQLERFMTVVNTIYDNSEQNKDKSFMSLETVKREISSIRKRKNKRI